MGARVALQGHAQQAARNRGCAHELASQCAALPQGLEGLPLGLLLCRQFGGGLGERGETDEGGAYVAPNPPNLGPASLNYPLATSQLGGGPPDLSQGLRVQKLQLGTARTTGPNPRETTGYVPVLTVRCELVTVTVACSPREMLGREGDV